MKVENWFLDRFIPWFISMSTYVGIITIFLVISYGFNKLLGWDIAYTIIALLFVGFLLPREIKNNRIKKEINSLVDEENADLSELIKEENLINYPVLNKIITKITQKLYEDGFINSAKGSGEESIKEKIKKIVWEKYRRNDKKSIKK